MGKKIALNIFYTLGLILSVLGIVWGFKNGRNEIVALLVVTAALFIYLKVQLIKEVRKSIKP